MHDREDRIRQRAHQLWIAAGHPEGQEKDHWAQAEREIDASSSDAGGLPTPGVAQPLEVPETETNTDLPETAATFAPVPPVKKPRTARKSKE